MIHSLYDSGLNCALINVGVAEQLHPEALLKENITGGPYQIQTTKVSAWILHLAVAISLIRGVAGSKTNGDGSLPSVIKFLFILFLREQGLALEILCILA